MRNTHTTNRATRTGDAESSLHRLVGTDTFKDGVNPIAFREFADVFNRFFVSLAHNNIGCTELLRQRNAVILATQQDNLLGSKAMGSNYTT